MSRDRYERRHRRTHRHPESVAFMASLDKVVGPAAPEEDKALRRLVDAAEVYMGSDPDMPSHTDTEAGLRALSPPGGTPAQEEKTR
jgi:hypothetical protein